MSEQLVVASNRGPLSFDPGGTVRRGTGGLVSALGAAMRGLGDSVWIASAMDAYERTLGLVEREGFRVRLLDIPPDDYQGYYAEVSSHYIWFTCHGLWDESPTFDPAAWEAYTRTNALFAQAIESAASERSSVLLQDYHLALVPAMLRATRPDLRIGLFWHVPFPSSLDPLPPEWQAALIAGLRGADRVGFQSSRWERNYLAMAPDAGAGVYPVGVDADELRTLASAPDVRSERASLEAWLRDRSLVLRSDRTEPSKNIVNGFLAFEALLERRPDLTGRVAHLARLTPSRRGVAGYLDYTDACVNEAERIEKRFPGSMRLEIADNHSRTLAAFTIYDVLVVNPILDGMNLVAKEGPILNERDGILVLSTNAGAWDTLSDAALSINPLDILETSIAIERAVDMSSEERSSMATRLRELASADSPARWLANQLGDIRG